MGEGCKKKIWKIKESLSRRREQEKAKPARSRLPKWSACMRVQKKVSVRRRAAGQRKGELRSGGSTDPRSKN